MAILDFKEIPEAHKANGLQDTFELFSRDFFSFMGYKVVTDPDRGADGGVDLVVEEKRTGVGGETNIKWLVSCKHKIFSGRSVSPTDEANIRDRVEANNCHGFIGFYSTLSSSGLSRNFEGMKNKIEYQIFDKEKIEGQLLYSSNGLKLAERYFPKSIKKWKNENPKPIKIFNKVTSIKCLNCNKELLEMNTKGIIVIWQDYARKKEEGNTFYEKIYSCCRGHCDKELKLKFKKIGWLDSWQSMSDIIIPTGYLKLFISVMNSIYGGKKYSDEAYQEMRYLMLNIFPYISRELTTQEKERLDDLLMIPQGLGGFG